MADENDIMLAEGDDTMPDDMGDFMDPVEALGAFLATEDGETVATSLASLKDSVSLIAKHLEKQNLILVKILTAMSSQTPQ